MSLGRCCIVRSGAIWACNPSEVNTLNLKKVITQTYLAQPSTERVYGPSRCPLTFFFYILFCPHLHLWGQTLNIEFFYEIMSTVCNAQVYSRCVRKFKMYWTQLSVWVFDKKKKKSLFWGQRKKVISIQVVVASKQRTIMQLMSAKQASDQQKGNTIYSFYWPLLSRNNTDWLQQSCATFTVFITGANLQHLTWGKQ